MLALLRSLSRWQQVLLLVTLVALLAHAALVAHRRTQTTGDFDVHREFGRRFLAGEPLYAGGLCFNYMPVSALFHAPLAWFPAPVAALLRYGVALVCLALTLHWLRRMAPEQARTPFAATALTLLLAVHYLVRDLDDSGSHLIYLALLVGGAYAAWHGSEKLASLGLGLAVALKMTPALLFPFLLWQRRWRLAAWTAAATGLWIALPALWMGPLSWGQHQREWSRIALGVFSSNPQANTEANDLRVQNQSLKLALMHALTTYPPGHPLRPDQGPHWSFLNLEPVPAKSLANLGMLAVFAAFCLAARHSAAAAASRCWPLDFAGLLLLMLLFSPVTWLQHLVWAVTALYLIVSADWSRRRWGAVAQAMVGLYAVLTLLLNRELLGKTAYLWLLANHLHTACLLLLLGLVLWLRLTQEVGVTVSALPQRPARAA